ncbi:MAG: glycosyltransferase family 2 protein, partial [Spirochaetia bacterium]|nr:glycosyltransferase family 2 protein [Spirochaetia bacterium]
MSDQDVHFEWIIGLNGGADRKNIPQDERIKIIETGAWSGVGDAKKKLCEASSGEILLELDHDDTLAEGALK